MANIGGEIKLSYGISYLTFDSKKEAKDFAKNLKNENFGPRELLLQQVDMEIDEMLKTDYIEDRLELLQAKDELRSFNKSLTTSGDIIWDDIRVNRTFYFGNWTSGAPTAGKIDGYRFVYKHSDNSSEYDYFSIEGDFTIYDGSRSGGSVGNKLDRYDAGVYLTSTVDEMLKAAPVTDALNLDADKGTNVSFSIDGTGTPSVSISFDWPRDGFHATLDAELTRGNKGSYTFVVNEDNYYDWLPGKFSVNYAAYLKSAGTFLTVDLTQGLSTNAGFYKNVDFYILDQLRNDY
ncbi:hypothetical protein KDJ56_17465 [Brevibacillus composti]|uniref:Uncharacterized protein n=1 Tax=Brevibacillus composti TaxID=2796470 RepID=A0A7T5JN24_9BACL|nr:hypothetical protein [Brevibacillus composti]QQE73666.1 hypothetical protein JD108_17525 [Brevibacillus composti]QUO40749.1 hypothetical protein KDJ56_17465 [Brevibacillus composti]